jgi:hypothetical protein
MAVKVELFLNATWTDVTSYVLTEQGGIKITFGVRTENGTADANTCDLTFKNTDGRFTPRNTAGAYYPYLTRNTPLRVSVGAVERFRGEVPEWPVRWNENKSFVTVSVQASGILRRLQRSTALDSTLKAAITHLSTYLNGNITGYWPIEDGNNSTSIASAIVGGTAGVPGGTPDYAAFDPGVMSREIANFNGGRATFTPTVATGTEFTAGFLIQFPDTGALTGGEGLFQVVTAGTVPTWNLLYSPTFGGNILLQAIDNTGAEVLAVNSPGSLDGQLVYVKLEVTQNGGNVDYAISPLVIGGTSGTGLGSIVGKTTGAPISGAIGTGVIPIAADVYIGHVVLAKDNQALFISNFDDGLHAYSGETIEARMSRLATQNNVTISVASGTNLIAEMGPQPDGSLLDVLRAAEKADAGGILRDAINAVGLSYITRRGRYNEKQATAFALDYAAGHLSPPLEPTDDDQNLRNDVTAHRDGGSLGRATLASGALSTAAYPSGVGPYPFEDTYATYLDSQLPYLAQWLLAQGTIDETRWPAITIDLTKNTSLVTGFDALRPGYAVTVANLPAISGATSATLQCIGWTEYLTSHRRIVTLNCVPGTIFHVFELDHTTYGKLDDNRLAY